MNLLDDALIVAEARHVFPCNADKSPRTPRGFHDATDDREQIKAWNWNSDGLIGATIPAGQVVIDVDPRNGGDETVALFAERGLKLPKTRLVETRSGGRHHYLTVPEDVTLRGTLGPGVDVKRPGKGYVIVPPSPGYAYTETRPATPAPKWLLDELVIEERPPAETSPSSAKFFPFERGTAYGIRALDGELARLALAREGGRNEALNRGAFAVGQLAAGGELDGPAALEDLLQVAEQIGLDEREARGTMQSGYRAGEQEPRQAPLLDRILTDHGETLRALAKDDRGADEERLWVDWQIVEEAPPFYLPPLLPKNAYVLVYGATEAAKSMTWVGLLAQGSHRGVRSSVYSLENPPHTDRDRLRRWAPDSTAFRLTNEPLDFNDPRQVEALVTREAENRTDVILIDTYSHAFNSRSEDGNAKAIEFARRVRYVMAQVGCSVVVVDHTGFVGDEPRDASAKRQQVDVAIYMEKRGKWSAGSTTAGFRMRNRKAARFANPFEIDGEIADKTDGSRGLELRWLKSLDGAALPSWA